MTPFLKLVANYIHEHHQTKTESLCVVLPNKRGAIYLKQHLASVFKKTIWLPTILSAEELISHLSGMQLADQVDLMCDLYVAYCTVLKDKAEPFETFAKWGNLMLQDFNEADRYLIDTKALYQNLREIKEIENWSLSAKELTQTQRDYVDFMQQMGFIYDEFTKLLLIKNHAYQGFMYRKANESFNANDSIPQYSHIIIAGFNALNKVETIIFSELVKQKKATILWDIDAYYFENKEYEAGLFLRKNFENKWLQSKNFFGNNFKDIDKTIDIIGVPQKIGQAQAVAYQLSKWIAEGKSLNEMAVVLADESLLFAIINQLPKEIESVNITMEYPLRFTPVFDLVDNLILIHHSALKNNSKAFYYLDVFKVLQNVLFIKYYNSFEPSKKLQDIIQKMIDKNYVWLTIDLIEGLFEADFKFIKALFLNWKSSSEALEAISSVLSVFNETEFKQLKLSSIDKEYIHLFTKHFNRLSSLVNKHPFLNSFITLKSFFKQIIGSATVPFIGEPLQGLQIMGVLETRTLDFENIILLGVNEGVLPSGKSVNSFIPNDLKRYHDMPLYLDKDAIYAYHFYRILQKASSVLITYNTEQSILGSGEKSRFITQLKFEIEKYHTNHTITEKMLSGGKLTASTANNISISKTTASLDLILKKLTTNDAYNGISPSALITFKDCSLRFFYRYGAGIKETKEVEENAEANTQGSILHESLELLYQPFIGRVLKSEDIEACKLKSEEIVHAVFQNYFSQKESSFGKNFLQKKVVNEYIKKLLHNDLSLIKDYKKTNNLLTIINLEITLQASIILMINGKDIPIYIKGSADRIDKLGHTIRVIDYKSSIKSTDKFIFTEFEKLFTDSNYNKMLQLFIYAWLVVKNNMAKPEELLPCIIPFKKFENKPRFILENSKDKSPLKFTKELLEEFEIYLIAEIKTILNPEFNFTQTEDLEKCEYCAYAGICNIN
ncbi:MAG: PD-(D/E)XK nuclease family protein [Bacteroidota bacterium]